MRRRGGRLGSPKKVSSAKSNHGAPLALTNSRSLCSCLQMATFDATRAQTMITAPKYDFRPLPYLVSLGVVGAATVGIFFGGLRHRCCRAARAPRQDRAPAFARTSRRAW